MNQSINQSILLARNGNKTLPSWWWLIFLYYLLCLSRCWQKGIQKRWSCRLRYRWPNAKQRKGWWPNASQSFTKKNTRYFLAVPIYCVVIGARSVAQVLAAIVSTWYEFNFSATPIFFKYFSCETTIDNVDIKPNNYNRQTKLSSSTNSCWNYGRLTRCWGRWYSLWIRFARTNWIVEEFSSRKAPECKGYLTARMLVVRGKS